MGRSIIRSVGIVAVAVVVIWLLGRLVGFHMSLWSSLAISVVLTLVLNLALGALSKSRRSKGRRRHLR